MLGFGAIQKRERCEHGLCYLVIFKYFKETTSIRFKDHIIYLEIIENIHSHKFKEKTEWNHAASYKANTNKILRNLCHQVW